MTSQEIIDRETTETTATKIAMETAQAFKAQDSAESAFKAGVVSALRAGWLVNLILAALVVFLLWQTKEAGKQMASFKQTMNAQNQVIAQMINELASLQDQKVNDVLRKYIKIN